MKIHEALSIIEGRSLGIPFYSNHFNPGDVFAFIKLVEEVCRDVPLFSSDCHLVPHNGVCYAFSQSCMGESLLPLFSDSLAEIVFESDTKDVIEVFKQVSKDGKVLTMPFYTADTPSEDYEPLLLRQQVAFSGWGAYPTHGMTDSEKWTAFLATLPKKKRYKIREARATMERYGTVCSILNNLDESDIEWVTESTANRWESSVDENGSDYVFEVAILQWLYAFSNTLTKFYVKLEQDGCTLAIGCFIKLTNGLWSFNSFCQPEFLDGVGTQVLSCAMEHLVAIEPSGDLSPTATYLPGHPNFHVYKHCIANKQATALLAVATNGTLERYKSLEEL